MYSTVWLRQRSRRLVRAGGRLIALGRDLTNAGQWTKTRSTATANAAVAPDGTTTAFFLAEDATAASSHIATSASIAVTSGAVYTLPIYVKAGTRRYGAVQLNGGFTGNPFVFFDSQTGTITSTGGTMLSSGIKLIGNGWYLVTITAVASSTSTQAVIYLCNAANTNSYSGDGASGLYVWVA